MCANGGWGNGFGGNNGGGMNIYPWMNQADITNNGFRDQMINNNITGIRDGINALSSQVCNGFAQAEIADNSRQMANMNQLFGMQTAITGGLTNLSQQFDNCCCENRLGIADLKYTIATENCADRTALNESVRDIIANQTANTQAILDRLCQDKIDEKNDTISQLRQELLYSRGQASQDVQTAALRAGQVAEVDALYQRLRDCPVPTMPVYGMQPIFTCNNGCNGGCGCGM